MKGRIFLSDDRFSEYKYTVEKDEEYGYCILIETDLIESFKDLITNSRDLEESINTEISLQELFKFDESFNNISFLNKMKEQIDECLLNAEYVEISFDINKVINYIKDNPILKNKKIILNESIGLNMEVLDLINLELDGNVDNLYFKLHDNTKLISFKECVSTYRILEEMVENVNRFDFSPLEKIMYVYDLVRNRVYLDVNNEIDESIPRDLSSVLLGNNIVCLGYARIFNAVLERLGINTREALLLDSTGKSGHARNEIYIKDEKYDVDGVYYFDVTWDSKKNDIDNTYLSSYKYFAKTKTYMDSIDGGMFIDKKFPYFSSDLCFDFIEICNSHGFDKIPKEMIKSINHMSTLINGRYLIDTIYAYENSPLFEKINIEEVSNNLFDLVSYFDRPLSANILLEVLYNVRKIQYYNEPDKFPFTLEEFYKTVCLSSWGFNGNNAYERMLVAIFGRGIISREHMEKYDDDSNLSKNIESVKLTKTLRRIYDRKK